MANTFTLISTTTVGSGGAASIDFTSIPTDGTYTDLLIVLSSRSSGGTSGTMPSIEMRFNSSTTGYTTRYLSGEGSGTPISGSPTYGYAGSHVGSWATSNTFSSQTIYIPNYAGSTNKSYSVDATTENNGTYSLQTLVAGLWSNTGAITSISLRDRDANNMVQYSTASLYGILKGSGGATVS